MRTTTLVRAGGEVVCRRCSVAETFATRLRGLLGRRSLDTDAGMLFRPGGSIHTCFMRFPIDVVLLDGAGTVVAVASELRPWRATWHRGARAAIELPAGSCRALGLHVGERLVEQPAG